MRIAEARVTPIAFRDPPLLNVAGCHQPFALRSIIEIITDDGVVGLGESYGTADRLGALQKVAPALAGMALHDTNGIVDRIAEILGEKHGQKAPYGSRMMANTYGAFEVAILDARARQLNLPLCAYLGGAVRAHVPYSAYLFYKYGRHADPSVPADDWGECIKHADVVGQAQRMVRDYGFTSLKLKAGVFEPDYEIETLRALRQVFPDHPLRIDPNAGWSVATTLRVLPQLDGLLEYLEDPTEPLEAMAEVARHASMPLATNMVTTHFSHLPNTIRLGAVQVVLSDHHFWGGLRATQELAEICRIWGLGLSMHSNSHLGISLAAMTHVGATIPNLDYACDTHYPWQTDEVIADGKLKFENGNLPIPRGSGLGVTLDRTALKALHQNYLDCGIRTRDDATEMRKHEPNWNGKRPRF